MCCDNKHARILGLFNGGFAIVKYDDGKRFITRTEMLERPVVSDDFVSIHYGEAFAREKLTPEDVARRREDMERALTIAASEASQQDMFAFLQ